MTILKTIPEITNCIPVTCIMRICETCAFLKMENFGGSEFGKTVVICQILYSTQQIR